MELHKRLVTALSIKFHNAGIHAKSIYRSALAGTCAVLGVVFVTGFSSGEVFNGQIETDASSTTTTHVDLPFHPPQLPGDTSRDIKGSDSNLQQTPSTKRGHVTSSSMDGSNQATSQTQRSNPRLSPEPRSPSGVIPDETSSQKTKSASTPRVEPSADPENSLDATPRTIMETNQRENSDPSVSDSSDSVSGETNSATEDTSTKGGAKPSLTDQPISGPEEAGGAGDHIGNGDGSGDGSASGDGAGSGNGSGEAGEGLGLGTPTVELVFATCAEAYEAGVAPIIKDEPGYSLRLDRDLDGIACELNLNL